MTRVDPEGVRRVAVVGAGVIGTGWALHFLRMGFEVVVYDPDPGAEARVRRQVELTWPTLERLGLRAGAAPDRLRFASGLEDAAADAEVVQESSPEDLARKTELFARLDEAAAPDVPLLTSTSGLSITAIQSRCRYPERTAVGHPFNPPYILPLVEVVGGERTAGDTVEWAASFYRASDKHPVCLDAEVPGFVATRLQEALWREMLHILAEDEATLEQVDAAITYGPGPRWAVMGPGLTFHLGGGPGGMAHTLDQFGPTLKEPWSRLVAPELTDELRRRLVDGAERAAAGRSMDELIAERDAALVEVVQAAGRA